MSEDLCRGERRSTEGKITDGLTDLRVTVAEQTGAMRLQHKMLWVILALGMVGSARNIYDWVAPRSHASEAQQISPVGGR